MRAGPQRRATWHDAFDAQMEIWRWVRTEVGRDWIKGRLEQVLGLKWDVTDLVSSIGDAALVEEDVLLRASPFFVSAEMCAMIVEACQTFTGHEPLLPSDLLATHGFVFFEQPIAVLDGSEKLGVEVDITGFSWGVGDVAEANGIFPTIYTKWIADWGEVRPEYGPLPRMLPNPLPVWSFEEEPPRLQDGHAFQFVAMAVALRLLNQFVPKSRYATREKPDRVGRRYAKKIAFPERDVTVVRLRREKSQSEGPPTRSIEYSHRFLRSGHWRDQWYPSLHRHRKIWIDPTVVGPADKPLRVGKGRVFVWTR